jgi:Protein of unknown function (DUF2510)
VSQTTASGSGGSAAAGWYTDPHDPRQLRWWSGETWTEHTSPLAPAQPQEAAVVPEVVVPEVVVPEVVVPAVVTPEVVTPEVVAPEVVVPQVVEPAVVEPVIAAPVASVPVTSAPVASVPVTSVPEFAAQQAYAQQSAASTGSGDTGLPSRRALRQAATEFDLASNSPQATAQSEQAVQPEQATQPAAAETAEQNIWNQPAQVASSPLAPEQNAWNQPVQSQPQLVEPVVAQPTYGQPVQTAQLTQVTQNWSQAADTPLSVVPAAAPVLDQTPAGATDGIDSLFGSAVQEPAAVSPATEAPAAAQSLWSPAVAVAPTQTAAAGASPATSGVTAGLGDGAPGQWGLTPSTRSDAARSADGEAPSRAARPEGWSTAWVWLIAISPLFAAASIGYALKTSGPTFSGFTLLIAIVAPYLLVLLFAVADRSALSRLGLEKPASWTFAALSAPIYLLVRSGVTRREIGAGTSPLVLWFVSVILAVLAIASYGFITHNPLLPGLPS